MKVKHFLKPPASYGCGSHCFCPSYRWTRCCRCCCRRCECDAISSQPPKNDSTEAPMADSNCCCICNICTNCSATFITGAPLETQGGKFQPRPRLSSSTNWWVWGQGVWFPSSDPWKWIRDWETQGPKPPGLTNQFTTSWCRVLSKMD